ncbi:MAG TPA: AmmeMemoRadiSam system protein A [Candidatus Limnocylindria bacterium]|nr:AmmeMemoRadiSam system protein A [Candidatus Limnocylindria bacterium]
MSSLVDREQQRLLEFARRALIAAVEQREFFETLPEIEILQRPAGAFVTLRRRGRLRGCIGQLVTRDPLIQVVAYCAKAAALEDPRFEPVHPHELTELEIELSVLSPLFEITFDQIVIGRHGLLISRGWQRGVLLPQVAAEFGWPAERFLEETCTKAGLERDAWKHPDTRVDGFTAEIFSEADFRLPAKAPVKPGYSSST